MFSTSAGSSSQVSVPKEEIKQFLTFWLDGQEYGSGPPQGS